MSDCASCNSFLSPSLIVVLFLGSLALLENVIFQESLTRLLIDYRQAIELKEQTLANFIIAIFEELIDLFLVTLDYFLSQCDVSLKKAIIEYCPLFEVCINS
jgi:hypothetical protein